MMIEQIKLSPRTIQKAVYTDATVEMYKGNPLIEALPPILSVKEFSEQIRFYPNYNDSERNLPANERLHAVAMATRFFQPLSFHVRLEYRISLLIRQGYVYRNPSQAGFWHQINDDIEMLQENLSDTLAVRPSRNSMLGMALIGFSGMGKSTSLREILSIGYPQLIMHREYREQPFSGYQVTWLMVDCPHDGSIRQLATQILGSLDQLLGTSYKQVYGRKGRATVNELIDAISRLAQLYNLGMLVVDEIQRLNSAKSQGAERMMNFFIELINTLGVPVVLVGTPNAYDLLSQKLALARRAAGQGDCYWNPMKKDKEWKMFVKKLWKYQYTKNVTPLTAKLSTCLHNESQGIIDLAIKIYMLAQIRAITSGVETVSTSLIESVCRDELHSLKPMLDAIRTRDWIAIRNYDDISLINVQQQVEDAIQERAIAELASINENNEE